MLALLTMSKREQIGLSPDRATLRRVDALRSRGPAPLSRAAVALAAVKLGLPLLERRAPAVPGDVAGSDMDLDTAETDSDTTIGDLDRYEAGEPWHT